jgi:hypothetical protein
MAMAVMRVKKPGAAAVLCLKSPGVHAKGHTDQGKGVTVGKIENRIGSLQGIYIV